MAENLWALREQKRLSVATLASRAGLPIGLIMEYESGQRSIDPRHMNRIARALYVEESEVRAQCDPRPGSATLERQARSDEYRAGGPNSATNSMAAAPPEVPHPHERQARPPRSMSAPRPPAPIRASQLGQLQTLLARLGRAEASVEAEFGKPLTEIDRLAASRLLVELQTELRDGTAERRRAYLPEAVDQYELKYLTEARDARATMRFTLFDKSAIVGEILGFGPYAITVAQPDGSEITLNKLAIVSYTRTPNADSVHSKGLRT